MKVTVEHGDRARSEFTNVHALAVRYDQTPAARLILEMKQHAAEGRWLDEVRVITAHNVLSFHVVAEAADL